MDQCINTRCGPPRPKRDGEKRQGGGRGEDGSRGRRGGGGYAVGGGRSNIAATKRKRGEEIERAKKKKERKSCWKVIKKLIGYPAIGLQLVAPS